MTKQRVGTRRGPRGTRRRRWTLRLGQFLNFSHTDEYPFSDIQVVKIEPAREPTLTKMVRVLAKSANVLIWLISSCGPGG
jgi:hypothetical protein